MVINLFSVDQEFVTVKDPTGHNSETNREKNLFFRPLKNALLAKIARLNTREDS